MANMRSTIAFGLFWINLIIITLVMYFSFNIFEYPKQRYYRNLRGAIEKEKLQLENIQYPLQAPLIKKDLRKLATSSEFDKMILYVDICSIFFLMILMFSFCLTENECCTSDTNANREFAVGSCYGTCVCCNECGNGRGDCKCEGGGGGGGDAGLALLVCLIVLLAFIAIFFILKACGKHISRFISVAVLALADLAIVIMCIMIGMDYKFNTYTSMTLLLGLIGFICNLLGIILPNLGACQKLRYGYMYVDNPANNNLPVQDINMVPVVTPVVQPPVAQPLIQQPVVQPMAPIYDQNQNQFQNSGYDNNDGNIYGAPPIQYQPPPPQDNNYYYNNMPNNYQYPAEKPVYTGNPSPQ